MKILCFLSGNILSGKEFVALDVIRGWKAAGHTVEVAFVGWHDGKFQQQLTEMNVPSHPIKLGWYYLRQWKWSLDSFVNYLPAIAQFRKLQKLFNPDIIYMDSYRQIILLKPFLKKKVVFHVHDPHAFSSREAMMIQLADSAVNRYVAVSGFIKNDLVACGVSADKVSVVYNGTHLPPNTAKLYMPEGVLRIGLIGQILERKGHEDVLETISQLANTIKCKVLIYGKGDEGYIQKLEHLIADKQLTSYIEWKGFEADKKKVYDSIDVVVAATRNDEPFALVALEAGAYKVPVIATRSGGFVESIVDGETGFIVEKNSPTMIQDKLQYLYNTDGMLTTMGNAAYSNIKLNFSLAAMQAGMNKIISA
ncbi:MAG: glycosyltransferase family 4 protein [Chitinophagales bacterium]|nr:glycosyltransferase family 4 protein [Chitinophagales bacterium]